MSMLETEVPATEGTEPLPAGVAPATSGTPCARCGKVHARCTGHRTDGEPCGRYALTGLTVCRKHGGGSPLALAKSARAKAWEAEHGAFKKLGVQADVDDPAEAFMSMVREAAGNVAFYRWRVQQLDQTGATGEGETLSMEEWLDLSPEARAATQRDVGSAIATRVDPDTWRAEMHVLVQAYDRERDRLVKYSKLACDAGIQERLVRAVEQDAQQLVRVIRHVLDGLGLSPEQIEQGRTLLREALEAQAAVPAPAAIGAAK